MFYIYTLLNSQEWIMEYCKFRIIYLMTLRGVYWTRSCAKSEHKKKVRLNIDKKDLISKIDIKKNSKIRMLSLNLSVNFISILFSMCVCVYAELIIRFICFTFCRSPFGIIILILFYNGLLVFTGAKFVYKCFTYWDVYSSTSSKVKFVIKSL